MRPNCRALIASLLASLTCVSAAQAQFLPDFHTDAKVDPKIIAATVPPRVDGPVLESCWDNDEKRFCLQGNLFGRPGKGGEPFYEILASRQQPLDKIAVQVHNGGIRDRPKVDASPTGLAVDYLNAHQFDQALIILNKAVKIWYSSDRVLGLRGETFFAIGENERALTDWNAALYWYGRINPQRVKDDVLAFLHFRKGQTLARIGRNAEAKAAFEQAQAAVELNKTMATWIKSEQAGLASGYDAARVATIRSELANPSRCVTDWSAWNADAKALALTPLDTYRAMRAVHLKCDDPQAKADWFASTLRPAIMVGLEGDELSKDIQTVNRVMHEVGKDARAAALFEAMVRVEDARTPPPDDDMGGPLRSHLIAGMFSQHYLAGDYDEAVASLLRVDRGIVKYADRYNGLAKLVDGWIRQSGKAVKPETRKWVDDQLQVVADLAADLKAYQAKQQAELEAMHAENERRRMRQSYEAFKDQIENRVSTDAVKACEAQFSELDAFIQSAPNARWNPSERQRMMNECASLRARSGDPHYRFGWEP